jgi:uncharacterized phiE125 gp8 family phage protein
MNNIYEIKVTDGAEPINLETAKDWLRVTTEDDDAVITDLITVARKRIEAYSVRSMVAKNIVLTGYLDTAFILPYSPVSNVSAVKYLMGQITDTGVNDWDLLDPDEYQIVGYNDKHFRPHFPATYEITYTTTANVDLGLKTDLKRVILWMYENRGDDTDQMPDELMSNAKTLKVLSWV